MRILAYPVRLGLALSVGLASFVVAFHFQDQALVDTPTDAGLFEQDRVLMESELGEETLPPAPTGPDIVVIVLDTLRADRLRAYGASETTMPLLDHWAESAKVYTRAMSDGPWTLPAHASLFTGLSPAEHGAHGTPLKARALASALNPDVPTLAERFYEKGYHTAAIAANRGFLNTAWGLDRGFSTYLCEQLASDPREIGYITGDRITALAKQYLEHRDTRPVFMFLNYMDAHSPWQPRKGYVRDPALIRRSVLPGGRDWAQAQQLLMGDGQHIPETEAAWRAAYDASVGYLDQNVGELLESLPRYGIGPEDWVFVMADHGEFLGEHQLVEHSKDLYQEVLHIPLLIRGPEGKGNDPQLLQLSDVSTRILAAAGLPPLPGYEADNMAVSELYWTRWKDLRNPSYGERFNRVRRAFREGDHVLIMGGHPAEEAYDLATDPQQQHPLSDADWIPALREAGIAWVKAHPLAAFTLPGSNSGLDSLKALGYVE